MNKAFLALAGLVLLAACSRPAPAASPSPIPTATLALVPTATLAAVATAPIAAEYAVYDAVINSNWPGGSQIVIEAATEIDYRADVRGYVAGQMTDLQNQTVDSFLAANQRAYALEDKFQIPSPYILLGKTDKDRIFNRDYQTSWRLFYSTYPGAAGIMAFSRVGFNSTMDQALVYYQNSKGGLDAVGYMVLMSKDAAGWVVKKQFLIWVA